MAWSLFDIGCCCNPEVCGAAEDYSDTFSSTLDAGWDWYFDNGATATVSGGELELDEAVNASDDYLTRCYDAIDWDVDYVEIESDLDDGGFQTEMGLTLGLCNTSDCAPAGHVGVTAYYEPATDKFIIGGGLISVLSSAGVWPFGTTWLLRVWMDAGDTYAELFIDSVSVLSGSTTASGIDAYNTINPGYKIGRLHVATADNFEFRILPLPV